MSWGIAETASEIEKIKAESADYLNGLNSCGEIEYSIYSNTFDFYAELIDKAYKQGVQDERRRYDDGYTGEYIKDEDVLKFYYVESLDDYWIGRRLDTMYYATWSQTLKDFVWSKSRYLPWGKHVVSPETLWKEHTYPSEPKEIPIADWLKGFYKKYFKPKWILCSERMPECEQEVLICTKKKVYISKKSGMEWYEKPVITPAIYEDGTMLDVNSKWRWEDIDYAGWDEEEDCGIVPEGWWENRHFNPDGVYNNPVDKEVIAWMTLPEGYKEETKDD